MRPVLVIAVLGLACGGPAPVKSQAAGAPAAAASFDPTQPEIDALLAFLSRSHRDVRHALGAHTLRWTTTLRLEPETTPDPAPAGPGVARPLAVTDRGELAWTPSPGPVGDLRLSQHNDHDRGRDIVVTGERTFSRLEHRPWYETPTEPTIVESWLDDANAVALDALEVAAPRLAVAVGAAADPAYTTLTLSLAQTQRDRARPTGGAPWRDSALIETLSGTLVIDPARGRWCALELAMTFRLPATGDGPVVRGSLAVQASLEPATGDGVAVEPPGDATVAPERTRLESERRTLLDGLAPT